MDRIIKIFVILIVVAIVSIAFYDIGIKNSGQPGAGSPVVSPDDRAYLREIDGINARWRDAAQVALSSPRMALAGPVSDLQAVRRDLAKMTPGNCTRPAHIKMMEVQDTLIRVLLGFMSQGESSELRDDDLTIKVKEVVDALNRCR